MVQTRSQTAKATSTAETTSIYKDSLADEAQLTNYLREKRVEDLLKNILVELCKATPDNVLEFIMEYISKQIALDGASILEEALSTDVTGETLVCHLESKDKPLAIDITDCISNQVDGTLVNDETMVITPKGDRCSKTRDPISAPRTTTCTKDQIAHIGPNGCLGEELY